jgi:phage terminase large subunit GpA-like protein
MKIPCNNCKKYFETNLNFKIVKKLDSGEEIHRYFVKCSHCKTEFTSYFENNKIKSNNKKIRDLREQITKENGFNKRMMKASEIKKLTKENIIMSNGLRVIYDE